MKETLIQIGQAIDDHVRKEQRIFAMPSVARYQADIDQYSTYNQFYLTNMPLNKNYTFNDGSINIYKNSLIGGALITGKLGRISYKKPKGGSVRLTIKSKAAYNRIGNKVKELELIVEDGMFRFATLRSLIGQARTNQEKLHLENEELKRLEANRKKTNALKKAAEAEAARIKEEKEKRKRAAAEAARLAEIERQQEEEAKKRQEEVERLENEIADSNKKIQYIKQFVRSELTLRSQHILDPSQEEAKRSHIYDGIPVLIDGGPGTGKTTTTIQRLKFLLSDMALREYTSLSKQDIDFLTNANDINDRWIFFSPNTMLLQYLRNNMQEENLKTGDNNTFTIQQFRDKMMLEYQLRNPDTNSPFKIYKFRRKEPKKPLILSPQKTIKSFETFCIHDITNILNKAFELPTSDFAWHKIAVGIKAYCKDCNKIKDIKGLINLFNTIQDNQSKNVKKIQVQLNENLSHAAVELKELIINNENSKTKAKELLEKWQQNKAQQIEDDDELEDEMTDETETEESTNLELDADLYRRLKSFLRALSISRIDTKTKLNKRYKELLEISEPYINEDLLQRIGSLAWFVKNYASITKGVESNILNQIPRQYKLFRKKQLKNGTTNYDQKLLKKIIEKDKNKHLHSDEQDLLIGYINNLLYKIYKISTNRFNDLKHKYVDAYKFWARPIIGIDEATDYSILDYYMMESFKHYRLSAITLSGDLMQGLTENGITDWSSLKKLVFPKLCKYELAISYRQTSTLVNIAREMYKNHIGKYPSYHSKKELDSENEPKAIACISDDEDEKISWIANRVIDVFKAYDNKMPSVAIFVGKDVNVEEFIEDIEDTDLLNGIEIVDCTDGKALNRSDIVRIFRISEVKGMEFEVAFFYNLDTAFQENNRDMMIKYLYVGLSRATTHLAATFSNSDTFADMASYFEIDDNDWKL